RSLFNGGGVVGSRVLVAAALIAMFFSTYALARDVTVENWLAKGKIIGKNDKKSEDISGIACSSDTGFPRTCLVIDDNIQSAQAVTLKNGELEAGQMIPLISDTFDGSPLELDGEGVAYASGLFYVLGS